MIAAGEAGIYVGVMLFDGWALHLSPAPDHIEGHPFHALNNVNGIAATSIDDLQVLPLDPRIEQLQDDVHPPGGRRPARPAERALGGGQRVVRRRCGRPQEFAEFLGLDRLPSWGDSTAWQYWVIDVVKEHEAGRGYDPHPIGMTMQFPVADQTRVNEPLLRSRADWISPGYDDEIFADGGHPMAPGSPPSRWFADPPVDRRPPR